MDALDHIWARHSYVTTFDDVSRFSSMFQTKSQLKGFITQTIKTVDPVNVVPKLRVGLSVTIDTGRIIGVGQSGAQTSVLHVILDEAGYIRTAFPY